MRHVSNRLSLVPLLIDELERVIFNPKLDAIFGNPLQLSECILMLPLPVNIETLVIEAKSTQLSLSLLVSFDSIMATK